MSALEGRFESSFENAALNVKKIMASATADNYFTQPNQKFLIDFVVRELLNNAVEHGNQNDSKKSVTYRLKNEADHIEISVSDQGNGFDLKEAIRRDQDSGPDSVRNRGLLAALKLNWKLSVQGGTVTARFEYFKKKKGELCK